jgi:hypothetical protein
MPAGRMGRAGKLTFTCAGVHRHTGRSLLAVKTGDNGAGEAESDGNVLRVFRVRRRRHPNVQIEFAHFATPFSIDRMGGN